MPILTEYQVALEPVVRIGQTNTVLVGATSRFTPPEHPEHPVSFSYGDSNLFEAGIRGLRCRVVSSGG